MNKQKTAEAAAHPIIDRFRAACGHQMPRMGPLFFHLFQKIGPKTIDTEIFPQIRALLDLRDETQMSTWWSGERFEKETCAILRSWLPGAPLFFDIGSNYGFFSFLALTASPTIRVHAFEPHPKTFSILDSTRHRNCLERLTCWNIGIGDRADRLPLHSGKEDMGHTSFGAHPLLTDTETLLIPIETFGGWRLLQGIPLPTKPEWIAKIDVEGFETKVLHGMEEELRKGAFKGISIEINPYTLSFCGTSATDIYDFFEDTGYEPLNKPAPEDQENHNVFFVPKQRA